MANSKDLENLKKDIGGETPEFKVESVNVLFLDISSTCTGYTIANVDFEAKKAKFTKAGALWLNDHWDHQEKYLYIHEAIINYFWIVEQIDYIVVEQYSMNPKKRTGMSVSPEMHGVVKVAAAANGVKVASFTPQSWRSELGIKAEHFTYNGKKKKDYKRPTKKKVLEYVEVPEKSVSNITNNERNTPSDLYDSIALGMGWLKRFGITRWEFGTIEYNGHIGVVQ